MEEYFIRITEDNAVETLHTAEPADFHFFNEAIGSRFFEIVRFGKFTKQVLVIDEEGRLRERGVNMIASLLARQPIFGTVLIAKEGERDGELDLIGFDLKSVTAARVALHVSLMHSGLFEDAQP